MPHGNKKAKGHQNNKKKKEKGAGSGKQQQIRQQDQKLQSLLQGELPKKWKDYSKLKAKYNASYHTQYSKYKAATTRFLDYM
eukprot:6325399-Ditylum_brightwellii.AAC.1